MTVYDLMKIDIRRLTILKKHGYVSKSLARDVKIYQAYLDQGGKNVANVKKLSADYNLSETRIYHIISKLSKKVKI